MRKIKKMLYIFLGIIAVVGIGGFIFMQQPQFGKMPSGTRLERIRKSPNYKDGKFQNLSHTPLLSSGKSLPQAFWEFLFEKKNENLAPTIPIPTQKTDLFSLNPNENVLVWLGHSSYFMQVEGKKYLIDPVLITASPIPFGLNMFKGSDIYKPKDIPYVDYLIITHDHYDHLDYETIKLLKGKIGKVVTALGVGEHFEYWGFSPENITELDWNEEVYLENNIKITSLPTRHSSGRTFIQKKTLWASFMLETSTKTIYIGGDSGYDFFFKQIGNQFPNIDLAIMENGQYNNDWRYIHFVPEDLISAIKDLKPKRVLAFHNSKLALAKHSWFEPLDNIYQNAQREQINLATPMIGQVVDLDKPQEKFKKWWDIDIFL